MKYLSSALAAAAFLSLTGPASAQVYLMPEMPQPGPVYTPQMYSSPLYSSPLYAPPMYAPPQAYSAPAYSASAYALPAYSAPGYSPTDYSQRYMSFSPEMMDNGSSSDFPSHTASDFVADQLNRQVQLNNSSPVYSPLYLGN